MSLRHRRTTLAAALLSAGLTACGGAADTDGAADASSPLRTRTVTHALGSTEVPTAPQRVVALGASTAPLVLLGIVPVGIGDLDAFETRSYAELLPAGTDLDVIDTIGDPYDPNLEAVTALEPDLIVGDEFHGEFYERLSAIAPTVLVEYGANGGWRERFAAIAEAVGRADRVAAVDAAYERDIAALPASAREQVVAFARADADGSFRIDSLDTAFPGSVAHDAAIPTLQPTGVGELDEGSGFLQLSAENLGVLAGAHRIVLGDNSFYDPENRDSLSVLEANPLWSDLPAVQAGRVEQVPGPVYNGGNHASARLLLRALSD